MHASVGDTIVVGSHRVGRDQRIGTIVEVLGPAGTPPFRVRWGDDEQVHIVVPGSDAVVQPSAG